MALSGHGLVHHKCPLPGVKRTSQRAYCSITLHYANPVNEAFGHPI